MKQESGADYGNYGNGIRVVCRLQGDVQVDSLLSGVSNGFVGRGSRGRCDGIRLGENKKHHAEPKPRVFVDSSNGSVCEAIATSQVPSARPDT